MPLNDAADPASESSRFYDRAARQAALCLGLTLPGDTVLYLMLPIYHATFGVSLPEAGLLLAANRLVRIAGYGLIATFYAQHGPRVACLVAGVLAFIATFGYALSFGLASLLVMRLLWGVAFALLNIANTAIPTAEPEGAARRSGQSRSIVALGPMTGLIAGALIAETMGPRLVFLALGGVSLLSLPMALRLPSAPDGRTPAGPRLALPAALDVWSFCFGLTLDGLFVVGLGVLASQSFDSGAALATGSALALRYAAEVLLSRPGGAIAERYGARRLLIVLSVASAFGLFLQGTGGVLLWVGATGTVLLRALLQPLPAPVVAEAFPGAARVPALARQATWRDLGAGVGPLAVGVLLPIVAPLPLYLTGALMLASSALWLLRTQTARQREVPDAGAT